MTEKVNALHARLKDRRLRRITIAVDIPYDYYPGTLTEDRWQLTLEAMKERAHDYAEKGMTTEAAILMEMVRVWQIGLEQLDRIMRAPVPR